MEVSVYASFGVLGSEYIPVFSQFSHTEAYEEVVLDVPDSLRPYCSGRGDYCFLTPIEGIPYHVTEALSYDDSGYFLSYYDGGYQRRFQIS